jgi:putative salt-induced outer membrane protein YdiY
VLRRDRLEFDSDELDDLTFDWEDVAEVRSPRMNTCRFDDDTTLVGTLWIRDDVVLMRDASGREHRFPRSWLLAIISGEPSERNRWSGKFSIGFTARRGNTDQTDFTASLNARRRTPYTRLELSYLGALGKLDGETNVANHNANLKFDVFLSRRFYLTIPTVEAFRDVFQNIAVRVTPGAGFGYQILDRGGLDWNVEAGGGYRITRYDSVEPGEDETNRNGAALFGTTFEMDITKDIDLKVLYRSQIGIPDTQDTNQHGELALGIELTGDFDLDIALIWDRVGDPRPDADGIVPEKDDFRLTVGVGLEF